MRKLNFGDYCAIEQKRYGSDNEVYTYKVIGSGRANYYRSVPVDANNSEPQHGPLTDVLKVIVCGVDEKRVETFRLEDVKRADISTHSKEGNKLLMMFIRDSYKQASGEPSKKTAIALMRYVSQNDELQQAINNSDWATVERYE